MQVHYKCVKEPFKHQADFFHFAYDKDYVAAFMGIGTGKTKSIIDVAANRYLEGKLEALFVIAPNGLAGQWVEEEMVTHCPIPLSAVRSYIYRAGNTARKEREYREFMEEKGPFKLLVTNVEIFSRDTYVEDFRSFLRSNATMLVVDEAHQIKSPDALRTQNILFGLSDVTRMGKRVVGCKPLSKYRAVLTGSMVSNSPLDLYSVMSFLKPDYFGMSYSSFKSRYALEKTDHVPGSGKQFKRKLSLKEMKGIRDAFAKGMAPDRIMDIFSISAEDLNYLVTHPDVQAPYKNLDELRRAIAPVAFIVKIEDCLDMPEKVHEKRFVEMGDEQKRVYKDLVRDLETEFGGSELTVANALTLLVRLSQVTSNLFPNREGDHNAVRIEKTSPKVASLIDALEENQTFPCIVFSRFVAEVGEAVQAIKDAFPDRVVERIVGEVPSEEREDIKTRFKRGDVDVLVATPGTISVGHNFQNAHVEYFLSNDYSYTQREQAEGRVWRAGQGQRCTFVDLVCKGTVDERIYSVLMEKKDLLEYMRTRRVGEFIGGKHG